MQPDLYLKCPDGRQLVCHKAVLSAASPRLNTALSGDFKGTVLPILGVDSAALEAVVGSFYTGSCGITASNVAAVYDAAIKLEVQNVIQACRTFLLTSGLTPNNCCTVLKGSLQHATALIQQRCIEFLGANFNAVVSSADFLSSSTEVVEVLLGGPHKQPRAAVLEAMVAWMIHDPIRTRLQAKLLKALGLSGENQQQQEEQQQQEQQQQQQEQQQQQQGNGTQWTASHQPQQQQQPQQQEGLLEPRCASALDPLAAAAFSAPSLMSLLDDPRPGAGEGAEPRGECDPLGAAAGSSGRGGEGGGKVLIPNGQRLGSGMEQGIGAGVDPDGRGAGPRPELAGGEGAAGDEAAKAHGEERDGEGASVAYPATGHAADGEGRGHYGVKRRRGEEGPHGGRGAPGEEDCGAGLATAAGVSTAQATELLSLLLQQQQQQQQPPGCGMPDGDGGQSGQAQQDVVQQVLSSGGLDALRQLLSLAAPSLDQQQQQQLAFSQQGSGRLPDGSEPEALAGAGSTNELLLQSLRRAQEQQLQGQGSHGLGLNGVMNGSADLGDIPQGSMLLGMGSEDQLLQAPYGMVGLGDPEGGCGELQAGGRGQRQQRPSAVGGKGTCHVDNCTADLAGLREYHLRYKICEYHLKAASIMKDGLAQRFCQQCGRFHTLDAFDGTRRSCRTMLQRHNARRAKKFVDPVGGAMGGGPAAPGGGAVGGGGGAANTATSATGMAALSAMTAASGLLGEEFLRSLMPLM